MRNVRCFQRALQGCGFVVIGFLLCGFTLAAKPVPPPQPPTPGTIFYNAGGLLYGMQSDGTGTTPVHTSVLPAPSSLVYGDDPVLDRWWLAILEIPGEQYPGFDINRRELFAIRPYWENGEPQFEQVQVSNLFPFFNPQWAQWSNGGDSFISMVVAEVATVTRRLVHIDVSGADIEASAALGIDPLVGPEGMEFILSGPSYETNFLHDWDPSGTRVVYVVNVTYPAATAENHFFVHDLVTGLHRRIFALGQFADSPRWSPDGSRILYEGSAGGSLVLINPENDLDAPGGLQDWTVFKQQTWKKFYDWAAWSPDGSQLIYSILEIKGFSRTRTTVRAALADGREVNLGLGSVMPVAWVSNLPGGP